LWGANGAGKTTILRCLLGVFPFDGEATALGLDVRAAGKTVRRLIGYVPQEVRLHGDLTGRETLRFYAALRKVAPARAEQLLAEWRLADLADKPVRALSGGMKQRLAVAIALLSDPPVLLLDEPTSNLDRQSRAELWSLLRRLKAAGKTLIVSLHRAEEVLQLADRVIVLEHGRKIAEGAPAEIGDALPPITLRVAVPAQAAEAAALLSRQGFDVQANGAQLWVRVPLRRKSEPLAALFAARIAVTDFELMEREESDE
jgi:ABC-type multidrug transport system ATPase subunit